MHYPRVLRCRPIFGQIVYRTVRGRNRSMAQDILYLGIAHFCSRYDLGYERKTGQELVGSGEAKKKAGKGKPGDGIEISEITGQPAFFVQHHQLDIRPDSQKSRSGVGIPCQFLGHAALPIIRVQ